MIEFNVDIAQVIGLLIGVVLPVLVGLVTTRVTSSSTRAILLAVLSFVTNLLTEFAASLSAGTAYDLGAALIAGLGTFIVAVAIQFGFWKPTGVSASVQAVGSKNTE